MKTRDEYLDYVRSDACDLTTEPDRAVVYANDKFDGHHRNMERAQAAGTTIEQTPGGEFLDKQELFKNLESTDADIVWHEASHKFASSVSGDVTTRVIGAAEDSAFRQVELPTLLANDKVTAINGVPREELKSLFEKDPEAAFNKVCESELAHSRLQVQGTNDPAALADLEHRSQRFAQQIEEQQKQNPQRTLQNASQPIEPQNAEVFELKQPPPPPPPPTKPVELNKASDEAITQ